MGAMFGYDHTQTGGWHWIMAPPGVVLLMAGVLAGEAATVVAGVILILIAGMVGHLRVWDDGDALRVRFGPLPLLGTRIPYDQVERVEVSRTSWLQGWGVHGWPGAWLVYNIWGFGAVTLHLKEPRTIFRFRRHVIGTDEPEALARFLRGRLKAADGAGSPSG